MSRATVQLAIVWLRVSRLATSLGTEGAYPLASSFRWQRVRNVAEGRPPRSPSSPDADQLQEARADYLGRITRPAGTIGFLAPAINGGIIECPDLGQPLCQHFR